MDWEFIAKYIPLYQKAAVLTVKIGILGIAVAILIGLVCETINYFKIPVLRRIVAVYIELSRNTPLLIQLFFIYYGLPKIGLHTDARMCGIAGLAFFDGSYMTEAFRSGVEAIDTLQEESAYSLGLSRMQTVILNDKIIFTFSSFSFFSLFLERKSRKERERSKEKEKRKRTLLKSKNFNVAYYRYIIFPQAVSISAPAFTANIIFLLSDRADRGALEE